MRHIFRWALALAALLTFQNWFIGFLDDALGPGGADAPLLQAALLAAKALFAGPASLLVGMHARMRPEDVLGNARRRTILEYLSAHPGASLSRIARDLRLGWGAAVHHLNLLESRGHVRSCAHGRERAFTLPGQTSPEDRVAGILRPVAAALLEAVRSRPESSQRSLAQRVGVSLPLAHRHLGGLERRGLVASTKSWRTRTYVAQLPMASQGAILPEVASAQSSSLSPRGTSAP